LKICAYVECIGSHESFDIYGAFACIHVFDDILSEIQVLVDIVALIGRDAAILREIAEIFEQYGEVEALRLLFVSDNFQIIRTVRVHKHKLVFDGLKFFENKCS
jgi:hypothetical protein